jgi:hypothetical protein
LNNEYLPILLDLKHFSEVLAAPGAILDNAIVAGISSVLQAKEELSEELLNQWRARQNIFILLDGLDEVPEKYLLSVTQVIARYIRSSAGDKSRLIVSSRLTGYTSISREINNYVLQPFADTSAIEHYVSNWLTALRPDWPQQIVIEKAASLLSKLQVHYGLLGVLDNPLLLRIATEIYALNDKLVNNLSELYDVWVENLWIRAVQRGVPGELKERTFSELEEVAWKLQNGLSISLDDDFVDLASSKLGALIRLSNQVLFIHLTLQEYFVAKRLMKFWQKNQRVTFSFLRPRLHHPIWREPLIFFGLFLDERDATKLLTYIARANSLGEKYLHRDMILVSHLIREGINPSSDWMYQWTNQLTDLTKVKGPYWYRAEWLYNIITKDLIDKLSPVMLLPFFRLY